MSRCIEITMSDVATASYRLLPLIILNPSKPVPPHLATKFQQCFSPGVIRVDPKTKEVSVDEEGMRKESMSREVLRHPEFEGCVTLARKRDHFICTSYLPSWSLRFYHRMTLELTRPSPTRLFSFLCAQSTSNPKARTLRKPSSLNPSRSCARRSPS